MEFINEKSYISKPDKIGENGDFEFSSLGNYSFDLDENINFKTVISYMLELKQRLVTNDTESINTHVENYLPIIIDLIIREDSIKKLELITFVFKLMFFTRAIRCQGGRSRNQFYIIFQQLKLKFKEQLFKVLHLIPHYGSFKDINTLMIKNYDDKELVKKLAQIYSDALIQDFEIIISPFDKNDDIKSLTKLVDQVNKNLQIMTTQQINDYMIGKNLSLASKWVPSCDKKDSKIRLDIISKIWPSLDCSKIKNLRLGDMALRKILTVLRQCCKVKEQNMTKSNIARNWKDIIPEEVPSKATTKYANAFLNLDETGKPRTEKEDRIICAKNFKKAIQDFRIKGAQSDLKNLADIIWSDFKNSKKKSQLERDLIDVQFKKMVENVKNLVLEKYNRDVKEAKEKNMDVTSIKDPRYIIPVIDVSGSMFNCNVGHYAIALGIICSSISKIPGKIITFSANPCIVDIDLTANIFDIFIFLKEIDWGASTNIDATYNLILNLMKKEKESEIINEVNLSSKELSILYLTDGQFNSMVEIPNDSPSPLDYYSDRKTLSLNKFDTFLDRKKIAFKESGFEIPLTIFWNLNTGNTSGFPAQSFTTGVKLVAGLSQTVMVEVMTGLFTETEVKDGIVETKITPLESFIKTLNDESFDLISEALK